MDKNVPWFEYKVDWNVSCMENKVNRNVPWFEYKVDRTVPLAE